MALKAAFKRPATSPFWVMSPVFIIMYNLTELDKHGRLKKGERLRRLMRGNGEQYETDGEREEIAEKSFVGIIDIADAFKNSSRRGSGRRPAPDGAAEPYSPANPGA
jgi:hypothetical protein